MTDTRPLPSEPDWWRAAHIMLRSRLLDQMEVEQLTPQGQVKYQFSASGHELGQVLLAQALNHPHDAATVYYRSRPFVLACGLTLTEAIAAGMARAGGPSMGRDVGVMFNRPGDASHPTIFPTSGDVGAQYSPAAGWAQAVVYRRRVLKQDDWAGSIGVAMGGEGSVAANGFWAALNMAVTEPLPLLIMIENNNFGISVPAECQTPGGNIAANLASYGNLLTLDGDGTDPLDAWSVIRQAVEATRQGLPCVLHLRVVRLTGHTFIDDQAYKTDAERQAERERDPLPRLRQFLREHTEDAERRWQALEDQVRRELDDAYQAALDIPEPDPATATHHAYYNGVGPRQGGLRPEAALPPPGLNIPQPQGPRINLLDAVRRALEAEMRLNPRLLVFGEDVGVKGGVHGATLDMQKHFGPLRVFDTSLNEDGIMGRSIGMALAGLLPAPEIQFRKYADPAHEQISDAGTLRWRTANAFAAPMVVRIPVGFGKKTGDPWHSVTHEAVYAHTLGWRIAFPSNAEDAVGLLRTALRGDDPTFFFEHRALLDTSEGRRPYPGDDYCLPFGCAAHLAEGDRLTVVTWGALTQRCQAAAASFAGQIDLFDLRTIIPWDQEAVLESVRRTGKLLIVHEDTLTAGFGAEIAAVAAQHAFTWLDAPIARLAVPDVPIPYNPGLMDAILPTVERIHTSMQQLLAY